MKPEDLQPEEQVAEDAPVWQALRRTSDLPEALRMLDTEHEPVTIERDGAPVGVMVPLDGVWAVMDPYPAFTSRKHLGLRASGVTVSGLRDRGR